MKNGFTLVELLAIIVLLGIIIVVAVPSLINSNKIADENKDEDIANVVNTACVSYVQVSPDVDKILNGETEISITARILVDSGYLKDDLDGVDYNKPIIAKKNNNGEITCNYSN